MSLQMQVAEQISTFHNLCSVLPQWQKIMENIIARLPPKTMNLAHVRAATTFLQGDGPFPHDCYSWSLEPYMHIKWTDYNDASRTVLVLIKNNELRVQANATVCYQLVHDIPYERVAILITASRMAQYQQVQFWFGDTQAIDDTSVTMALVRALAGAE